MSPVVKPRALLTMTRCALLPFDALPNVCARCGRRLTGRQTRWCSRDCQLVYERNHYWNQARDARLKRDNYTCGGCGWRSHSFIVDGHDQMTLFPVVDRERWLEVNHRIPRVGRGYSSGCHHHQDRLETLCHVCHVKVTRRQRISRQRRQVKVVQRRRELASA
jgi:5-methylcytosine-specific restriction endonuclease McrA